MKNNPKATKCRFSGFPGHSRMGNYRGIVASFLVLLLAATAGPVLAKTLERSCKGAEMIKYELGGKQFELTGAYSHTGKGTSKGTVPSPVKARQRACKAAAKKAADAIDEIQLLNRVCAKHKSGSGRILFIGGIGRSHSEHQTQGRFTSRTEFLCQGGRLYQDPQCGNGKREGLEQCDNGANNSDTLPNACRTHCVRASCGDGVIDQGEQCDKGPGNNDEIPGACRTRCKRAYCGDGVLDITEGEMCDDGNNNPYDGCYQCRTCIKPKDNLAIIRDTRLCAGTHRITDPVGDGAIRVTGSDVTLDCRESQLVGPNKRGIGILVTGSNVVLRNCNVKGFSVGIDIRGDNAIVFDARACGNGVDMQHSTGTLFAARNRCNKTSAGWSEAGKPGCTSRCQ